MKKLNKEGLTLLELMLAMTIATFVIGAVAAFIATSSKSYNYSETETSIQSDAQIIMNQMSNIIMSSKNVKFDTSDSNFPLLKIYITNDKYAKARVEIKHDTLKRELYLRQVNKESEESANNWSLMGEAVKKLVITDTGADDKNSVIGIDLVLEKEVKNKTFTSDLSSKVTLRNQIVRVP